MYQTQYLSTASGVLKLCNIIVGAVVIGVGCHAYFESWWTQIYYYVYGLEPYFYQSGFTFPYISLEQYFIAISIIAVIVSLASLIPFAINDRLVLNRGAVVGDMILQIFFGVLVLIGGALMIYSAYAIEWFVEELAAHNYFNGGFGFTLPLPPLYYQNLSSVSGVQYYEEKIAAGVLAVINGLLYFITGASAIWATK